jgi:hypothetical protein
MADDIAVSMLTHPSAETLGESVRTLPAFGEGAARPGVILGFTRALSGSRAAGAQENLPGRFSFGPSDGSISAVRIRRTGSAMTMSTCSPSPRSCRKMPLYCRQRSLSPVRQR